MSFGSEGIAMRLRATASRARLTLAREARYRIMFGRISVAK